MGFLFSKLWTMLFGKKDICIFMVGLDAAGKTSILYHLKGEAIKKIPGACFNIETLDYKGLNFTAWDVGDAFSNENRRLLKYSYPDGLVFVVDSNDRDRIEGDFSAREELQKILAEEELKDCAVLVMANKQDLNGAMTPDEVAEKLGMGQLKGRTWFVQGTSAITGQGIEEGLDWLTSVLLTKE